MKLPRLIRSFEGTQPAHHRAFRVRTTKVPDRVAHQAPSMVRTFRPILSPEHAPTGRFAGVPATCGATGVLRNWWFAFARTFLLIAAQ